MADDSDSSTGSNYYLFDTDWNLQSSQENKAIGVGTITDTDGIFIGDTTSTGYCDLRVSYIRFRKYVSSPPTASLVCVYPNSQFVPTEPLVIDDYLDASGNIIVSGSGNADVLTDAGTGTGTIIISGDGEISILRDVLSGSGTVIFSSSGNSSLSLDTLSGEGFVAVSASVLPLQKIINIANAIGTATKISITRSISDAYWRMSISYAGEIDIDEYSHCYWNATDKSGNLNRIFYGVVPAPDLAYTHARKSGSIEAFDYGIYLAKQYIPTDAQVMSLTGSRTTWDHWISYLLEETGIVPYKISVPTAGNKEISLTAKTSKLSAIQEICDWCSYIFYVYWDTDPSGDLEARAYFIPEDDIDDSENGLGLTAETINWEEDLLVDIPKISVSVEERINRVRVRGCDASGNWYAAVQESAAVTAGEEWPREYIEEPSSFAGSQTAADSRAAILYDYFSVRPVTVELNFKKRHDLRLYQKIQFTDSRFPDSITSLGWLRITSITYSLEMANETVSVTAQVERNNAIRRSISINDDLLSTISSLIETGLDSLSEAEAGTVTSVDGSTVTMETNSGKTVTVEVDD